MLPPPSTEPIDSDPPYAAYLPGIRARYRAEQAEREAMRLRARADAEAAAGVLRQRFGATRVILFGSVARPGGFFEQSDIDLAVSGIPVSTFFRAWAEAARVASVEVDVVDLAECSPTLRTVIDEEGIEL